MIDRIKTDAWACDVCDHIWIQRGENEPQRCPNCQRIGVKQREVKSSGRTIDSMIKLKPEFRDHVKYVGVGIPSKF